MAVTVLLLCAASSGDGVPVAAGSPHSASVEHRARVIAEARRALDGGPGSPDATLALARVARLTPRLTGRLARAALRLLARPTGGRDPYVKYAVREHRRPLCTPHFCVHWVDSTRDAPNPADANANGVPDFVERIAFIAEVSYRVENGRLNWRRPTPDRGRGGNSKTDIYLADLRRRRIDGYESVDPGQRGYSQSAYMVMDQDFEGYAVPADQEALIVVSHEYNHVLQAAYNAYEDSWATESGAAWMEDRVFPTINEYFGYLPAWVRHTEIPLTAPVTAKIYGSAVFNHWLSGKYGRDIMRSIWSAARRSRPEGMAANAYNAGIRRKGRSNFPRDFARFAADTAEWRSTPKRFGEGRSYPDVKRKGRLRFGRRVMRRLDHTAYQLLAIKVPSGTHSLRLSVRVGRRVNAGVALVGRRGRGRAARITIARKFTARGGRRSVKLRRPRQYSRVTAVIVNADIGQRGYNHRRRDWRYSADNVPFRLLLRARR